MIVETRSEIVSMMSLERKYGRVEYVLEETSFEKTSL
jgi:hypothetical protein